MLKLLWIVLLGGVALVAQLTAVAPLLPGWSGAEPSWPNLLAGQTVAAFAAALFFYNCVRDKPPAYRNGLFAQAFCLCLFLPLAGQGLLLCMWLAPALLPHARFGAESEGLSLPRFNPSLAARMSYGAGARLRFRLGKRNASEDDRVHAMVSMRTLPLDVTGGLLHDLLSDPLEEVRLLAYGIPNAAENAITQRILATSRLRDAAASDVEKCRFSTELAELHWELIHQGLVHGELYRHTRERVERYAYAALALDENNGDMWYLLGRCALEDDRPGQAEVFFEHAQVRGFPAQRLLPWQAQVAFMQGEFARIGVIIEPLRDGILPPALQASVRYWTH